jgi:hypothetical protein
MDRRTIIGIVIGVVVLCAVTCVVLLFVTGIGQSVIQGFRDPEKVSIAVDAPAQARRGETVTIELRIQNTAGEPQVLDSVDIDASYLEGIAIERAQPPFSESFEIPLVDMQSYSFGHEIPPGGTLVVQLSGTAARSGDHSGDIDVCINTEALCETLTMRTVVR